MEEKKLSFGENFRKYLISYIITFSIAVVVGVVVFLLVFFLGPNNMKFIGALDGLTIGTLVLLGGAGLMFIARQGMFDSLTYGFNQMTTAIFNKKANRYNDFHGYLQDKRVRRAGSPSYPIAVLFASIPFAIATIVMFILSKTLF